MSCVQACTHADLHPRMCTHAHTHTKYTYTHMHINLCYNISCHKGNISVISCRPGDVLDSVNGVNLSNVDHCDAVCAISENKGALNLVRMDMH